MISIDFDHLATHSGGHLAEFPLLVRGGLVEGLKPFKWRGDRFPRLQRLLIEHWRKSPLKFIDSFRHIGRSNIGKQPNIEPYAVLAF
jgi:hypothetical protein